MHIQKKRTALMTVQKIYFLYILLSLYLFLLPISSPYSPNISRIILSEDLVVPTRTNILNTNSSIYFHTIVTGATLVSTTGGLEANSEYIIQDTITTTPSKQTAQ